MKSRPFVISGVRLTHDSASVGELEAAGYPDWRERLEELIDRDGAAEAAVLQTCNRIEEYVVAETAEIGQAALTDFAPEAPDGAVVQMGHEASLRHLLRVAAGLESQVLGEDQILGQLRTAYAEGQDRGTIGPVLEEAFLKAIHVGERARSETGINEGTVSLGRAAVEFVRDRVGLSGQSILVIGAGEMAGTVLHALGTTAVDGVRLANRSVESAETLAAETAVPVTVEDLSTLAESLSWADAVFSATGSLNPIVTRDRIVDAGETVVVDLAQPGDIADPVAGVDTVTVYDLDDLEAVTRRTHAERREAAEAVEAIVEEEYERLLDQYKRKRADAVIATMYQGAERIKQAELTRAENQLAAAAPAEDITDDQREVLDQFADALVSQLLSIPTKSLREAAAEDDWETISTALELFDPTPGETDLTSLAGPNGGGELSPMPGSDSEGAGPGDSSGS